MSADVIDDGGSAPLIEIGETLWLAEGGNVSFYGFPCPTLPARPGDTGLIS